MLENGLMLKEIEAGNSNASSSTVGMDTHNSILRAIPDPKGKAALPPVYPLGSPKGITPTYYNPMVPSSDLFSPSQRCLFKSDLVHPARSNCTKTFVTSPDLSPINSASSLLISPMKSKEKNYVQKVVKELIGPVDKKQHQSVENVDPKTKGTGSARGKRTLAEGGEIPKSHDSPRPKRGRPSAVSKNA